jgi:hypothetical protein
MSKNSTAKAAPAKQNASQKIEALENALMSQNGKFDILAEEIDRLRQMMTALTKRLNASIQAAEDGGLTSDSVNKIILGENMKELEAKVQYLVEQGVLQRNDDSEITDRTFVVGREIDTEGNVVNPRVQFSVNSVDGEVKSRLLTKKAGNVISYSETEPSLEITEVYQIVDPNIKKNFEAQPST